MPPQFNHDCQRARQELERARERERRAEEDFQRVADRFGTASYSRALQASIAATDARKAAEDVLREKCDDQVLVVDLGSGLRMRVEPHVDPAEQKDIEEVLRDKIPPADKDGLDWIRLQGEPKQEPSTVTDERTGETREIKLAGSYNRERKVIDDWYPPGVSTIKHELGHHVFHHKLTAEQRRAWQDFWKRNVERFPTDYAKVNSGEGFAEAYEFFRNNRDLDDEIRRAMERLVGPNPAPESEAGAGDDQEVEDGG